MKRWWLITYDHLWEAFSVRFPQPNMLVIHIVFLRNLLSEGEISIWIFKHSSKTTHPAAASVITCKTLACLILSIAAQRIFDWNSTFFSYNEQSMDLKKFGTKRQETIMSNKGLFSKSIQPSMIMEQVPFSHPYFIVLCDLSTTTFSLSRRVTF